jgi:hypothetical protein
MTLQLSPVSSDSFDLLQQAAIAYRLGQSPRPSVAEVIAALLSLEKAAKDQRIRYPFSALAGQWRLCFTTGVRKRKKGGINLGKGFYLPKFAPATIGFEPKPDSDKARGQISNQIQLGRLKLRFIGPARFEGKQNLLAFDFTEFQFWGGDRLLFKKPFRGGQAKIEAFEALPIAKLPFFAFFLVTDDLIAARGRGGGLALWFRDADA